MQTKQEHADSVNTFYIRDANKTRACWQCEHLLDQGCKQNKSLLTVWTHFRSGMQTKQEHADSVNAFFRSGMQTKQEPVDSVNTF